MAMEPWEAEEEERYAELYEEHRALAIESFRAERLTAHYLANPEAAAAPVGFLDRAISLRSLSTEAALVLAAAANEVTIKSLLLRPLISGLVSSEALAPLLADELLRPAGFDRSKNLLFALLERVSNISITTYRRAVDSKALWEELTLVSRKRNAVVHRCETAEPADADLAIALASELLLVVFPLVLTSVGLHVHDRMRVCSKHHIPDHLAGWFAGA